MVLIGWFSENLFHSIYQVIRKTVKLHSIHIIYPDFTDFLFINCLALRRPRYRTIDSSIPVVLKLEPAVLLGSARQFSGDREAPSIKINTTLLNEKILCEIKFTGNLFFQ